MRTRISLLQRRRPVNRFRQRIKIHWSTAVISLLVINLFTLSYLYLNLGTPKQAFAGTMTVVADGNWTSASTWSSGRVPQNSDTLLIPAGIEVNVDVVTQEYQNMKITVYGTLHFDGGKKIRMCDGMVDVKTGGYLLGDNNGSKIDICSYEAWNGSMSGTGPMLITGLALPVALVYFKATTENKNVTLQWETASQVNCDYFSVERSANGSDFFSIAKIKGKGNSNQRDTYSYTDEGALTGTSYYRLTQFDFNGASQTFNTVSINMEPSSEVSVYPNPIQAGGTARVEIPVNNNSNDIEVTMMSIEGKKIFSKTFEKNSNLNNVISFQTDAFLCKGTFLLMVKEFENRTIKKIVVI